MVTLDAILLGGGTGKRFSESTGGKSSPLPKQFEILGGAPIYIHSLKALLSLNCFRQIVLAFPKPYVSLVQEQLDQHLPPLQSRTLVRVVAGGDRRQDSSYCALTALEELTPLPTRVVIHDACRPILSPELLERVRQCLLDRSYGAWVPVVPVVETLKKVENSRVVETVDRDLVQRVQTPQIFEFTVIRSLIEKALEMRDHTFTDDAALCEYFGIPVGAFEGDVRNIKLTYGFELDTLKAMLAELDGHSQRKVIPCESESVTTSTV